MGRAALPAAVDDDELVVLGQQRRNLVDEILPAAESAMDQDDGIARAIDLVVNVGAVEGYGLAGD